MGQHFTPTHIAELTLCGLRGTPTSILDPMAGYGGFLEQSVKRYPYANIVGVEIDPLPLHAAKLITDGKITLISADVFAWAKERVKDNPSCNFYAIVGNAAYVSYQNLPKVKTA